MQEVLAYALREEYSEDFSGNVSLLDGEFYDVGEALDEGDGRIVLGVGPRENEDGEVTEAEALRSRRDAAIADALKNYPALEPVEVDEDDEPPSYSAFELSIASGPTLTELRARAGELDISGRSSMSKAELAEAIAIEEARLAEGGAVGDVGEQTTTTGEGGTGDGDDSTDGSDD